MLRSIKIEDLRGIRKGQLSEMTEVNVIVGPNNAGKSTILEAICLGTHPDPQKALAEVLQRRSLLEPGNWLIHRAVKGEPTRAKIEAISKGGARTTEINRGPVTLSSDGSDIQCRVLRKVGSPNLWWDATTGAPPPLKDIPSVQLLMPSVVDQSQLPDLYTRVTELGLRGQVKDLIKAIIPDLEDVDTGSQKGQSVLYLRFPDVFHPAKLAGDGIVLLIKLALELATATGGLALLEEPETHLHPAALRQTAKALHEAAKRGIQIVLTTHSLDLIDNLLAEFSGQNLVKISVFHVQLEGGDLKSYRLTGDEAARARSQIEDDLR